MTKRHGGAMLLALFTFLFLLTACREDPPTRLALETPPADVAETAARATEVNDAALSDLDGGENWLAYGRTYQEQRHSPLSQIDDGNIGKLGVDWYLELPRARSLPGTPLVIDGVMYFEEFYNVVHAVDATSGESLWEYDPDVIGRAGPRMRVMWDYSRGLAFWKGKVFSATIDGRLIAIDAKTGKEIWSVMTFDPSLPFSITGAPKVFAGKVIIGNGGTEMGAARGFVTAYEAETGEQAWRFFVVPGNPAEGFENEAMAMAAETWTGEWWKFGGGGNVWNGITYDPEFDTVYIGTGNGSPWNRKIRSPGGGDNLFLCAIVALDAQTGNYKWHYQTVPGESWDYNSSMDIVLADLEIGGRTVKALMHAPKNGFFYVIDRATGKLLSAEPFARINWATHVDMETGRPVETPGARYEDNYEEIFPSALGAHSWHPMSYNPATGLVYIPAIDWGMPYDDSGIDLEAWESPDWAFQPGINVFGGDAPADSGSSTLKAWDPVAQKLAWERPTPGIWNAGTLTTAGNLVFQGQAGGSLVAYAADNGEEVWSYDLGLGISAPPVSYSVGGRQYISILVGWGGAAVALGGSITAQHGWAYGVHPRRLITFSLDGTASLPASPPPVVPEPLSAPDFVVDEILATRGEAIYKGTCTLCHGPVAVSGGSAPDLRASPIPLSAEAFADVVSGGARRSKGMPAFEELDVDDVEGLRHYVRKMATQ